MFSVEVLEITWFSKSIQINRQVTVQKWFPFECKLFNIYSSFKSNGEIVITY